MPASFRPGKRLFERLRWCLDRTSPIELLVSWTLGEDPRHLFALSNGARCRRRRGPPRHLAGRGAEQIREDRSSGGEPRACRASTCRRAAAHIAHTARRGHDSGRGKVHCAEQCCVGQSASCGGHGGGRWSGCGGARRVPRRGRRAGRAAAHRPGGLDWTGRLPCTRVRRSLCPGARLGTVRRGRVLQRPAAAGCSLAVPSLEGAETAGSVRLLRWRGLLGSGFVRDALRSAR